MRRRQNTLLAGIAALALVAGTGVSLAQNQPSQSGTQDTTTHQGASTSATTKGGAAMQHGGAKAGAAAQTNPSKASGSSTTAQQNVDQSGKQAGKSSAQNLQQSKMDQGGKSRMSHAAQNNEKHQGTAIRSRTETNATLQERGRTRLNTAEQGRYSERARFSERERVRGPHTRINTAEQRGGYMRSAAPNTAVSANTSTSARGGGNFSLSGAQRAQIDQIVDAPNAPWVHQAGFDVRVGAVVPRGQLRAVPVSQALVQIEPRWRGYNYFVYNNQIVVVSPRTMRIVAVLPA